MGFSCRVLLLLSGLGFGAALAQAGNLDTPACLRARSELDAALQASTQDRQANARRLQRAREQARVVCLGGEPGLADPAPRTTVSPPAPVAMPAARPPLPRPIAPVSPVSPVAPATPTMPPPLPATPPPVAVPGPRVLGPCDATGCWDTQGNRLPQGGGMTSGPNGGLCSVQGQFAICP